jgi:serine/threonine-protein kinase
LKGAGPAKPAGTSDEPTDRPSLPDYDLGSRIGQGGMGEVLLGHDKTIGRDVAIKRLRRGVDSPHAVGRFLREARIQARLEHPSIVPVHSLGRDRSGDPFFTMKLLVGMTLADSLAAAEPPTLQELLRSLVDVCRAIELAHARGVVHRDLKPQNIMLGNFGEVYVLDWGVARIVDEREAVGAAGDVTTLDGLTEAGALFGTPGYMAPEQVEGSASIGPPADIYALGAILFEILTHEALHPSGKRAFASTLGDLDPSAARRRPDLSIPPELDQLCATALDRDPDRRPTIRALADALQRYLDGDRDHERRCQLAMEELASARATLASGDVTRRTDAIRSAGRALALDPESREAATLITQLMLEPPKQHPPALAARLSSSDATVQRRQGRAATLSLLVVLVFLGWAAFNGARDGWLLVTLASFSALLAVLAWSASRRAASVRKMWIIAIGNALLAALISRLFGSLIVAPVVTCVMAVSLTSYPQLMQHARIVIAMLIASWLGPVALESAGVLVPTWRVDDGSVISMSSAIQIGGTPTSALLIGANVLAIAVIGLFANALARSRHAAQRDLEIQAWHLRQLLPE